MRQSHLVTFVATGGAGKNRPPWAEHLEQAPFVLIALDNDEPDERGVRPGDEGAAWWEKNLSRRIRWLPWKKDINDMLLVGINIREWVQDGIEFYKALDEAKSTPAPAWIEEESITEPTPMIIDLVPEQVVEEPMSEDDLALDGPEWCSKCLEIDINRAIPAAYEHDGFMYCEEHHPQRQALTVFADALIAHCPDLHVREVYHVSQKSEVKRRVLEEHREHERSEQRRLQDEIKTRIRQANEARRRIATMRHVASNQAQSTLI
jgi:hypothetical protein